jgi:hypothetical protein
MNENLHIYFKYDDNHMFRLVVMVEATVFTLLPYLLCYRIYSATVFTLLPYLLCYRIYSATVFTRPQSHPLPIHVQAVSMEIKVLRDGNGATVEETIRSPAPKQTKRLCGSALQIRGIRPAPDRTAPSRPKARLY